MVDIHPSYQADAADHLRRGKDWLEASDNGRNCAAISYAALELRFSLERLVVGYWVTLLGGKLEKRNLRDIESFSRIENRIYELGGHQGEIDNTFEFIRIMLTALQIDTPCETPKIGKIRNAWHNCSALCHVGWPIVSSSMEAQDAALKNLTEVSALVLRYTESFGWPTFQDPATIELRDRFFRCEISTNDVLEHFRKIGLYAVFESGSGEASRFLGTAVPPRSAA